MKSHVISWWISYTMAHVIYLLLVYNKTHGRCMISKKHLCQFYVDFTLNGILIACDVTQASFDTIRGRGRDSASGLVESCQSIVLEKVPSNYGCCSLIGGANDRDHESEDEAERRAVSSEPPLNRRSSLDRATHFEILN
jgi:hypothetical protein